MTSFAFIFGCLPLWFADGAGAAARRMLGTTVVAGMTAATALGIFLVPALFVAFERLAGHHTPAPAETTAPTPSVALAAADEAEPARVSLTSVD